MPKEKLTDIAGKTKEVEFNFVEQGGYKYKKYEGSDKLYHQGAADRPSESPEAKIEREASELNGIAEQIDRAFFEGSIPQAHYEVGNISPEIVKAMFGASPESWRAFLQSRFSKFAEDFDEKSEQGNEAKIHRAITLATDNPTERKFLASVIYENSNPLRSGSIGTRKDWLDKYHNDGQRAVAYGWTQVMDIRSRFWNGVMKNFAERNPKATGLDCRVYAKGLEDKVRGLTFREK